MKQLNLIPTPRDYVIVIKDGYLGQDFSDNEKSLSTLVEKLSKELLNGTNKGKTKEITD